MSMMNQRILTRLMRVRTSATLLVLVASVVGACGGGEEAASQGAGSPSEAAGGSSSGGPTASAGSKASGGATSLPGSGGGGQKQAGAGSGQGGAAGGQSSGGKAQGGNGQGGATGAIACETNNDCVPYLPETKPPSCAKATCDGAAKTCRFAAKDFDGDGHGTMSCKSLDASITIELGDDCDDGDEKVYPGAWDGPEGEGHKNACDDGLDNDCDGKADDDALSDSTGCKCVLGDTQQCSSVGGNPIAYPGGTPKGACRYGSQTCIEQNGKTVWGPCANAVGPTEEICDKKDNDCDGATDEEDALDKKTWRWDWDGDQHGDDAFGPVVACDPPKTAPEGCVEDDNTRCSVGPESWRTGILNNDCDDSNPARSPEGVEFCDGLDNNCDGNVDEDVKYSDFYWDDDGDGVPGVEVAPVQNACAPPPCPDGANCAEGKWMPYNLGQTPPVTDLCDHDKLSNPNKQELCDGLDNDCDGQIDEDNPAGGGGCESDWPGECKPGTWVCLGGAKVCQPTIAPDTQAEVCDAAKLDENCDGTSNEGCACGPGETTSCSVGTCPGKAPCVNGQWDFSQCVSDVPGSKCECSNGQQQKCVEACGGQKTCSNYQWPEACSCGATSLECFVADWPGQRNCDSACGLSGCFINSDVAFTWNGSDGEHTCGNPIGTLWWDAVLCPDDALVARFDKKVVPEGDYVIEVDAGAPDYAGSQLDLWWCHSDDYSVCGSESYFYEKAKQSTHGTGVLHWGTGTPVRIEIFKSAATPAIPFFLMQVRLKCVGGACLKSTGFAFP